MKKILSFIGFCLFVGCAGSTIIAPEIEIKKDGTVKIAFEATVTKTASTSTTAYSKPEGK
jgi:hypothetical protein